MLQRFLFSNWWSRRNLRKASAATSATLAIDQLPPSLDPLPCGCNTALWGPAGGAMRAWQYHLLDEMLAQAPVLLLAPDAAQAQAIAEHAAFAAALQQGRLKIYMCTAADQQQLAQQHAWVDLLADLGAAGLHADHGLLCLDLFPALEHTSLQQLCTLDRVLRQWAQRRKQPSVWCFLFREGFQPAMERRNLLSQAFPYAATLQQEHQGLSLLLHRWNSAQGAVFQTRYGLHAFPAQQPAPTEALPRLRANGSMLYVHDSQQTIVAEDIATVYTTSACVQGIRLLPPGWVVLPTWEALEQACQGAIAATVLIDAGPPQHHRTLAALVHRLRRTHPISLKIAVQETTDHLRIHTEEALTQLGMNTVIYKDSQFSRTVRRLEGLQHTWFHGQVADSVDEVLQGLTPITESGYQSPEKFCQVLQDFLQVPLRASLRHSLVRMFLLPTVSHTMALQQLKLNRMGEVFTNDAHSMVIFLYACREADMDKVLSRIFLQPLGTLFQSQESWHSIADIQHEIKKMHLGLQKVALPDYSVIFERPAMPMTEVSPSLPSPAAAVSEATRSDTESAATTATTAWPEQQQQPSPAPATRQPQRTTWTATTLQVK